MNQIARLYRIQTLLRERRSVSRDEFLRELEVSLATFKRDLAYLRDRLNVPVEYSNEQGGYRLVLAGDARHEIPGLWLNEHEIHALLTMHTLLCELEPGLLGPHMQPILVRLHALLNRSGLSGDEVRRRIRIFRVQGRQILPKVFAPVSSAVLGRTKIHIHHFNRSRGVVLTRTLSPQRLTYYRDNWYLDAWCHLREGIRSFALDAIEKAEIMTEPAIEIEDSRLDAVFVSGYGIFGGTNIQWAVLRFSAERARWVSREVWHPQQRSEFDEFGRYVLQVPYSDDRELIMDILRHIPEVEVLQPEELRLRIRALLEAGLNGAGSP